METPSRDLEPWHELTDKVVLVTGASSGLGYEFCVNLAKAGCKVVAAARRVERLKALCDEINKRFEGENRRAVAIALDVAADGGVIEKAVNEAWDAFGGIDALVNNAGVRGTIQSPIDLSEEEWNDTLKTNLTGTWLVSKYVCKRMVDAKREGSVINISSIGALNRGHLPGGLAYAASKGAINIITKMMAMELGPYNIRVNSIAPGLFKSEITQGLMQKEWLHNVTMRTIPLRDTGTIDPALTSLIRYLIHDSSKYVTGNIFIVDAGATLPGVPIFSSL